MSMRVVVADYLISQALGITGGACPWVEFCFRTKCTGVLLTMYTNQVDIHPKKRVTLKIGEQEYLEMVCSVLVSRENAS